jgi:hypothetical protein
MLRIILDRVIRVIALPRSERWFGQTVDERNWLAVQHARLGN